MIIVTGGCGFIGSNIIKGLNKTGKNEILVVDDLTDGKQKLSNLSGLKIADYIDYQDFLTEILSGKDVYPEATAILHQGACSSTNEWNGRYLMKNNYEYSKHVLEFCSKRSLQMIYASSASVYGLGLLGFSEDDEVENPINMYAYSKALFDSYVSKRINSLSGQVVGLRYFNVYGPNEQHKTGMTSPVYNFAKQVVDTGVIKVFRGTGKIADGNHRRDFVSVEDVVRMNLWFLDHLEHSGIFNCGTGKSETFNSIAENVIKFFQKGKIEYIDFPESLKGSYQDFTEASLDKLRSVAFDQNFVSIEDGIHSYLNQIFPDRS
jgi:ADP-L-glycero-D-manno-heptose 6-epimerase